MIPHSLLASTLFLLLLAQILRLGDCGTGKQKQRQKREWIVPVKKITENVDYSTEPYVSKIQSDNDDGVQLRYTLRGPGITEPPVGCFIVDEYKGWIRITRPLDREERGNYTLIGTAYFPNNSIAEDNIAINIAVEDENDNSPVFIKPERSSIYELSPVGTFVTQVVASDADQPNTLHTKIAYSLIKQEPNNGKLFFAVNKDSGIISVNDPTLDREDHSPYVLTIQAADMYGGPQGRSTTATLSVDLLDVNDNVPTLEKDEFSVSVDENVAPMEVLRIQALDIDEERTDNWLAVFEIVSGNEDGRFSIETDPRTNMGILYLNKPVDFESASNLKLNLAVANKAFPGAPLGSGAGAGGANGAGGASGAGVQYGGSGAGGQSGASGAGGQYGGYGASGQSGASGAGGQSGASGAGGPSGASGPGTGFVFLGGSMSKKKSYLVNINVRNKPEGPKFKPQVKPISVSENTKSSIPRVIDTYTAVEEDTGKPAEKVKYAKGYDPDNWISINTDTAEIKLTKVPDRESPFVVNGTYYAKILCITDEQPSQTSTGTIALQVEDLNDNCPKLLDNVQTICSDTRVVNVTAEDIDSYPNGAPLEFSLIHEKTDGKWNVQRINDVSASLLAENDLWSGFYQVTMEIRDMKGLTCPDEQVLHLEVCTCSEGVACGGKMAAVRTSSATLGVPGISFLILGFLCLILVPMALIKCECGNAAKDFIDMPFETKQHLISYTIEGKGEDMDVLQLSSPTKFHNGGCDEIKMSKEPFRMMAESFHHSGKVLESNQPVYNSSKMVGMIQDSAYGGFYCDTDGADLENSAICQEEQEVLFGAVLNEYFMQKCWYMGDCNSPEEGLKEYDYEGEGSIISTIDNCSYNEVNDDLEFLDNLGSKFTTLAEVCGFRQTQSMSKADPKVTVSTVETTPTTTTAVSSNQMTNTVQPSPEEITKSPLVQTAPSQGMVIQEPMYYGFNQPMQSNILLSEDGLRQSVYIIDDTREADSLFTQGNGHELVHFCSGQQGIIDNSSLYSQIRLQNPVMINEGLGEVNPAVIQSFSPTPNLVMMPQQQLDGTGSLQMVKVPMGSVVSGESGQARVTLQDGSVNGGMILVAGPNHSTMSPQPLYQVNSQEFSGPTHMDQRITDGSFSNLVMMPQQQLDGTGLLQMVKVPVGTVVSRESRQARVTLRNGSVNGGMVLVGSPNHSPMSPQPHYPVTSQELSGPVHMNQRVTDGSFSSGEGRESRLLVRSPSITERGVNGGSFLFAEPGQYPVSMSAGTRNLVSMPQVATGQVNNSQLLVSGPFSSVQNIVAGEGGQSRLLVNGQSIVEGAIQHPLP